MPSRACASPSKAWPCGCPQLCADDPPRLAHRRDAPIGLKRRLPGRLSQVGNETGLGTVPPGELTRRFVAQAGALHQTIAQGCDRVTRVAAGLPLQLK